MITSAFSGYQVLGVIALSLVSTGGLSLIVRLWASRSDRAVVTDDKVSEGWRRYAAKLEKRLDDMEKVNEARFKQMELYYGSELKRKDEQIAALEKEVSDLRHQLVQYQTTQQLTSEVKQIQVKNVQDNLHAAVDENIESLT